MIIFRSFLVKLILRKCAKVSKLKLVNVEFKNLNNIDDLGKCVEFRAVYTIKDSAITKHYNASEPGSPLRSDKYESLTEFVYSMYIGRAQSIYSTASMLFSLQPETSPTPEIRKYLEVRKQFRSRKIDISHDALEISKILAKPIFRKIDTVLETQIAKIVNGLVFRSHNITKADLYMIITGDWKCVSTIRTYTQDKFTSKERGFDGIANEVLNKYKIKYIVQNMICMEVSSDDNLLPYDERIIFSSNQSYMMIINQNGIHYYSRLVNEG